MNPAMSPASQAVTAAVRAAFPGRDIAPILAILDPYGAEPHHREIERVRLAIVALSRGSEERLLYCLNAAMKDYRDVLCWLEVGDLSEEQGREAREAALGLMERWGGG